MLRPESIEITQEILSLISKVAREKLVLAALPDLSMQIVEFCPRARPHHHR